tara:strand:- start:1045 stop:1860 length:816 start_codon:yes stop_codon:yes gene_type:complete
MNTNLIILSVIVVGSLIYYYYFYKTENTEEKKEIKLPPMKRNGGFKIKPEKWKCDFQEEMSLLTPQEKLMKKLCPRFTENGFTVMSLPKEFKYRLKKLWKNKQHLKVTEEPVPHRVLWGTKTTGTDLINLLDIKIHDRRLDHDLKAYLKPLLEKWSKTTNMRHTSSFGLREYKRGAVLKMHLDRIETHVISAIIHVEQDSDRPWPLVIFDDKGKKHEVLLDDENDLVLYESVSQVHGRPYPFQGESFVNLFIHYCPPGWEKYVHQVNQYLR